MPRLVSAINNHTLQHDSTIISYSLGISTWCPSCELSYITVVDDQYCATMTKVPFSHFLICQKHCLYSSSTLFFGLIKTKCCSGRPMLSLVHVLFVIATCLWIAQDCYILYICSTKQFFSSIDYESASSFLYTLCWFSISVCLPQIENNVIIYRNYLCNDRLTITDWYNKSICMRQRKHLRRTSQGEVGIFSRGIELSLLYNAQREIRVKKATSLNLYLSKRF